MSTESALNLIKEAQAKVKEKKEEQRAIFKAAMSNPKRLQLTTKKTEEDSTKIIIT